MTTNIVALRRAQRRWACGIGLIASVVVIGTSCSDPTGVADVASVLVTPTKSTFTFLYDTVRFTAVARNARGEAIPGHSFTWSVEPAGVLDVRSDGLVTALGPGSARVIATSDTISGSANVSVAQVVTSVVSVTVPVRFTALGDTTRFGVEARDAGGAEVRGTSFTYRSSNDSVVSVSPTGSMKAVSPGFAYVAATAVGKTDSIRVDVIQDVATVVISPDTAMIQDGTTRQFSATPKDRNGYVVAGRSITWATTDSRVVTVNAATGLATAQGRRLGPATLTATTVGAIGQAPVYVFAPFIDVSASGEETCAITSTGRPYCWGLLNYATLQRSEIPLAVTGAPPLRSIGTGAELSCGLANDGTAYCWARAALPNATVVASAPKFTSLSVGQSVYGLTSSGALYTWSDQAPTPTLVPGGVAFTAISATFNTACATVASGAAYCWGSNIYGSIGDSTYQDRTAPTPVYGGLAFASISDGGVFTCGITTGGSTYCWGANGGAFGDGTNTPSPIPVPAAGGLALASITTEGPHSCGLDASGIAFCWGLNDQGEVGDSTFVNVRLSPVRVTGGLRFALLSAGGQHTCGLTINGALYCWGRNYDRELGDGTATKRAVPTLVAGSRP